MSDLTTANVPGQGEGTPPEPTSVAAQSPSAVKPATEPTSQEGTDAKPVTAQDLATLREEMKREIQSQVDKRDTKVREKLTAFDASIEQLKTLGKPLPEQDVADMRVKVAEQARTEAVTESIAQPNDPFDTKQWPNEDPVTLEVIQLQKTAGIEITGDMPEAGMIVRNGSPFAFVRSYEAALKAAKDRLSASTTTTEPKPTAPPAARIPAGGGSPASENMTGREYLKQASRGE